MRTSISSVSWRASGSQPHRVWEGHIRIGQRWPLRLEGAAEGEGPIRHFSLWPQMDVHGEGAGHHLAACGRYQWQNADGPPLLFGVPRPDEDPFSYGSALARRWKRCMAGFRQPMLVWVRKPAIEQGSGRPLFRGKLGCTASRKWSHGSADLSSLGPRRP